MKNSFVITLTLAALILSAGCVTKKKKGEDVGWFKRGYHNVTSKYNYWFNADELFTLTTEQLADQHTDNYNQLLDIYPEAAVDPQSARGDLDNVITKASKGIALHRPSEWVDDCYTLIGQAQFMKRDYETAENTFKWIKDEHDPKKKKLSSKKKKEKVKKKKKKKKSKKRKSKKKKKKKKKKSSKKKKADKKPDEEQPANTATDKPEAPAAPAVTAADIKPTGENPYDKGWQREAAYPKAMIWFGRTLTEREKYDEAEFLFRDLWEDPWLPEGLRAELSTAEAYLWVKQKKYDRAIPPLSRAIELTRRKKDRARLAYILAQLYERAGNYEQAYAALETVLSSNPAYEMEFNARLHQIQAGWTNRQISSADANRSLERMAKDDKNLEYRDQIYYVMADIALKDGLKKDGIAYLRQSLDYNQNNTAQRAESYLKLADLYYEDENFVLAKNYYDSTLTVLPALDERQQRVKDYAENLKDIARLIQTIAANDSIVRIFYMDDDARKELAQKIKRQREEEAEAAARAQAAAPPPGSAKAPPPLAGNRPSSFYFYNEAFLKKGKRDFNKVWGNRKLEDNWRRSNRPLTGPVGEEIAKKDSARVNTVSDAELKDLFASIPKSEAELTVLHLATYEAMYQLGTLYRDRLQHNMRCAVTLEEMLTRYPDMDKYEKEAWYYLYLAFTDLKNASKAKYYLDKLVGKYPNSSYARALTDPNFMNATKARERELNSYYEQTFTIFQDGKYQDAFERCKEAPQKYGSQNPLMAKFALLSALCTGNLQGNDAYCQALAEVIGRYPESAEATRAKEIARLISCKGFEVEDKKKNDVVIDDAFTKEDDKLHYFIVSLRGDDIRLDDVKVSVSDYNRENHRLEQLRISNIFLGADTKNPLVVIRKFDNKNQAMRYYNEVKDQADFLGESEEKKYDKEFFAITQENYRRILKNRTLDGYREFFEENYLK
ncbi:MAG: tetratricopeptide repeat protein [Saprospiraceae bacterium]|nr:tetratricopeptide repeat protein [Saprospiraceae bacterium]